MTEQIARGVYLMPNDKALGTRNNYFSKPRRSVNLWVIYMKRTGEKLYFPRTDVHGQVTAYSSKSSASAELYNTRQYYGKAYLQKVGPIS